MAERRKRVLGRSHHFVPVANRTSDVFDPKARDFLMDVVRHIHRFNLEEKGRAHQFQ